MPDLVLDAADPGFAADPHPVYDRLRRTGPVQQVRFANGSTGWLVTSYDEARQALTHPDLSNTLRPGTATSGARAVLERHMLTSDAPEHTRLRRLVTDAFSPRRIAALTPVVRDVTDGLVRQLLASGPGPLDLVSQFAFPLPVTVIFEVLGVPLADRDDLRSWTYTVASPNGPAGDAPTQAAWAHMLRYFADLIAAKRAQPTDDLFSDLVVAEDDGGRLTEAELLGMAFLLLFAGYETTMNLIGSTALALLSDPALRDQLRAEPARRDAAVEELLRHASPIEGALWRRALRDATVGDVTVPAGDTVLVLLAAANRDPGRFDRPHTLDFDRPASAHLAFGYGAHYCVGAHLARLEARIALGALLDDVPTLQLAADPADIPWRPGLLVRGPARLPVTI